MIWEILLSATIETGLGFLAEIGFGDSASDIRERLLKTDQKKRRDALQKAFTQAIQAAGDDSLEPLLVHRPFQEEVIKALLDPINGMDVQAVAQYWGDKFPEHVIPLRRFFNTLQNTLLADQTWGEVLERYQSLRFRQEVQQALLDRQLPISDAPIVRAISAQVTGGGAIALGENAIAVGAGSTYIGGDYHQIVQVTIQQFLGGEAPSRKVADARQRYLRLVSQQANLLPWMQLTADYASPELGENLRLADVYIDLDTTELEARHVDHEEELRQLLAKQQEVKRIPAQEIVNRERAVLLMGDPGSGKSTFVKYLAYLMAQANLAENPGSILASLTGWKYGALLPVRVELRYLSEFALENSKLTGSQLLLKYIHSELDNWELDDFWPALNESLHHPDGGVLILLDGLDEVPTSQRQLVVDVVNETKNLFPAQRYIVTCRPYAYVGQPWRLRGFHEVTLAPFNEEQINRFIDNWYQQLAESGRIETRAKATVKANSLKDAVRRRDLIGLAERPLLLTVMAQLHAYAGQLPEDRTQLYADAVQLLLQRWEGRFEHGAGLLKHLDIPGLKMSDLEQGLYNVAFHAQEGSASYEETADLKESDLCEWLKSYLGNSRDKAELFVDYIRERAGLLIRHKTDAYTFPHRSFQEFLAACHWLTFPDYPGQAARMIQADWDRWREVFLLAVGHAARTNRLSQAVAAVNELLPCSPVETESTGPDDFRASILAARALLEIGLLGVQRDRSGQNLLARTRSWLEFELSHDELLPAVTRAEAGRLLGKIGDMRKEVTNIDAMQFCHVPAGEFWMGSNESEGREDERPEHNLLLPEFWIGRYPVTNAQYDAFVQSGGYAVKRFWVEARQAKIWWEGKIHLEWAQEIREGPADYGDPFNLPNYPVVGVTWYEALAFTRWLDECLREKGAFPVFNPFTLALEQHVIQPGWRVVLPSEAEWEKAARGTDKRAYPWGNQADPNRANYDESSITTTSPVGCFPGGVSPYGVQDLSGNVWEWTRSKYDKYRYQAEDGREDLSGEAPRVQRGGSFGSFRGLARCAFRDGRRPGHRLRGGGVGFRVVVSPYSP